MKENMKVRSLLTFILTLLVCVGVDAQDVKLSKNIFFEGEVSSKVPTGRGTLKLMPKNPRNNNDEEFITIRGNYSGSEITEIYVRSKGRTGDMCFKHATYKLDAKENALSITFKGFYDILEDDSHKIIGNNDEYRFDFVFDKKNKIWNITNYPSKLAKVKSDYTKSPRLKYKEESFYDVKISSDGSLVLEESSLKTLYFDNGVTVKLSNRAFSSQGKSGSTSGDKYWNKNLQSTTLKAKDGTVWKFGEFIFSHQSKVNSTITFPDGAKYEGTVRTNSLEDIGEYGVLLLGNEYDEFAFDFVEGKMVKANGKVVTWKYGHCDEQNVYDNSIQAYPIDRRVGDFNHTRAVYLNTRTFDGYSKKHDAKELQCLVNGDVAGYYGIENIKTELQKKAFTQTEEYKTTYFPHFQAEQAYLWRDEYMVKLPLKPQYYDSEHDLREVKYDLSSGRFLFEVRDTENKKINEGCSDFHFLFYQHLCLTYPRSLVSMTSGKNWLNDMLYVQNAQTGKVSEADALKVENNFDKCEMVWVFKFEKVKDSYIYGKTTRIYIANKETGEIYCDLSDALGASQGNFKSTKVIKDNSPKKVYHSRGKQENCGLCLGTGKGWGTPTCPNCGGKGWYIEHYW